MTLLHDYLNTRNQQGFQRLLDTSNDRGQSAAGPSTSGGRSWSKSSALTSQPMCDVNARDWLGRTALHIACASFDKIEYVKALLKHPAINVNLVDTESHWTALHRAMYIANIPAALLLLQRGDTDASLKDLEGYTAFDLYNSTVNGSKPYAQEGVAELYTWGANRNAALGLADGGDRLYPDQVVIQRKEESLENSVLARFSPIRVRQVQMSKLHTAVVTSESGGNIRLCGFGSGGRLGPGQYTQYSLKPLAQLVHTVVSVALGQDHTLALTSSGEVLSWGLNRFSQLGYIVEPSTSGRLEEPIQATPKKIYGPLRKEVVKGVAASKSASACWTDEVVFTWGTNNGQLGYDKAAQPVQIIPRIVTKITQPVIDIALTDSAMACLLENQQVECIWNDRHYRINFPTHAFPSEIQPYRPPQAIKDAHIAKITSCDDTFAALSSNGEVFIFAVPTGSDAENSSRAGPTFRPQRVWALRKKFSAVKDVALGTDGSIIICTESGHVFVRTRNSKSGSGKAFKFQRVPFIQRVTQVCANSTGAFGALRVDFRPDPIKVHGNSIAQDLNRIQPYLAMHREPVPIFERKRKEGPPANTEVPKLIDALLLDEENDVGIEQDIKGLLELCDVITKEHQARRTAASVVHTRFPYDADLIVHVQSGATFPAHRVILAARSAILKSVLEGSKNISDSQSNISIRLLTSKPIPTTDKTLRISIGGCQTMSALILLQYFYSDGVLAVWDRRVSSALEMQFRSLKINPAQVKTDLHNLARILSLPCLSSALEPPVKRPFPQSMGLDMVRLFQETHTRNISGPRTSPLSPDVILRLADRDVYCHSSVLRSRSEFFANFFDEQDWTRKRWDVFGVIAIDLKHLEWHIMQYVLRFVCCGADAEMFDELDFLTSVDAVLEFMFDVMAAANELLLDRLVLLCSTVILAHSNLHNSCYVLADATHYHAEQLVERLQSYMTVNMEVLLESKMLDEVPYTLVKQLSKFARSKQTEKWPISRSDQLANVALEKNADWLALQDIPEPILRSTRVSIKKDIMQSPTFSSKKAINRPIPPDRLLDSPKILPERTIRRPPSGDDIFIMDDTEPQSLQAGSSALQIGRSHESPGLVASVSVPPIWKASSNPRVDMKKVMAEEAAAPKTPKSVQRMLQVDAKKPSWSADSPGSSQQPSRPNASPWKIPVPLDSGSSSLPTPPASAGSPRTSVIHDLTKQQPKQQVPLTPPRRPGFGPVITPTRQQSLSPNSVRHVSSKAWTLPPVQPLAAPSPPASGMSFVAIQHSQLEQLVEPRQDKRSLLEIQEEEQARQKEEDFLRWWTAEEERVKLEAEQLSQSQNVSIISTPQQRRKKPKERAEGRGRGGGVRGGSGSKNGPNSEVPGESSATTNTNNRLVAHPRGNPRKQKVNATIC